MADRFCSSCGTPLEPDAHFCANCTLPVGGGPAVEPTAVPASTPGAEAETGFSAERSVQAAGVDGTSGQRKRRNLLLSAVALIFVVGLAVGITLFFTRSSGQSGELFLESANSAGASPFTDSTATRGKSQTTAGAPTTPAESGCGSPGESFSPETSDERTLVSNFKAINDKDYTTAWNLLGDRLQSEYGSPQAFADTMATHISCVRVLDINPIDAQEYRLQFAAQYTTPFPAGSGHLPDFWTASGGRIVSFGTGP